MSLITDLTRMWLTRSVKPFVFKNEFDRTLPFEELDKLGLYVHLPFCKSICSFCPYCKVIYDEELCNKYIDALIKEIHMVGSQNEAKKTVRDESQKRNMIIRLNKIEGQVRGIKNMVERDEYCPDILIQVSAVRSALESFSAELLKNHIKGCVVRDLKAGKEEVVDELLKTLQKLK